MAREALDEIAILFESNIDCHPVKYLYDTIAKPIVHSQVTFESKISVGGCLAH